MAIPGSPAVGLTCGFGWEITMNQNVAEQHKWYNVRWFKRMAPIYDWAEFVVAPIRARVAEVNFPKGSKVLDMACGTGAQSIAFAKKGFSVVGVDLSPHMLARAKKKVRKEYDVNFICRDASEVEYPDSYFDFSSISFGLHDMPEEIGFAILKEMKRTTKQNGKVIIVDYHVPKNELSAFIGNRIAKIWESKYYDYFLAVGLEHYLKKVGFKIESKEQHLFGNVQIATCINVK